MTEIRKGCSHRVHSPILDVTMEGRLEPLEHHERRCVAEHEAAHAVTRYLYGRLAPGMVRRFSFITVIPTDEYEGLTKPVDESWLKDEELWVAAPEVGFINAMTRRRIEHAVMVSLAGTVWDEEQQRHDWGTSSTVNLRDGSKVETYAGQRRSDLDSATTLAQLLGGSPDTTQALIDWLWLRTRDFLLRPENQSALHALADNLIDVGTLRYREAAGVMDAAITQFMVSNRKRKPQSNAASPANPYLNQ